MRWSLKQILRRGLRILRHLSASREIRHKDDVLPISAGTPIFFWIWGVSSPSKVMHSKFYENNPFRRLRWRAERVVQMVEHRPSPLKSRSFDDDFVRVYRRFLLLYLAAGDDENKRYIAFTERPEVYHAHMLHYHPDRQRRQILEASLLTEESFGEIANRYSTEDLAIEFYEALFFNVRDRLKHKDWIAKVILGPREYLASNRHGTMTEDQRGFLYRLFAFHGGSRALNAMVGLAPMKMPQRVEDVPAWFDHALGQLVQSRAATAAGILEINKHNVMHLIEMALTPKGTATARKVPTATPQMDDAYLERVVDAVERSLAGLNPPDLTETRITRDAVASN